MPSVFRKLLNQVRATFEQVVGYLLVVAVPVGAISIYVARRRIRSMGDRKAAILTTVIDAGIVMSLLLIIVVALLPSSYPLGGEGGVNLVPFRTIAHALTKYDIWTSTPVRSMYSNILLFMPVGFFIGLRRELRAAVVAGLAVSFIVELGEYLFLPGRTTDVDDLILNTTGALLGALVARLVATKMFSLKAA